MVRDRVVLDMSFRSLFVCVCLTVLAEVEASISYGNLTTVPTSTVTASSTSECPDYDGCQTGPSFPNFIRPSVTPTNGCDIYGPLCQTGTIVVAVNLTSTTTITTVPCSSYVSAQSASVNSIYSANHYDGTGPFDYLSSFGRSPECTSLANDKLNAVTTFSNCPNDSSGLRGVFTDYYPLGITNIGLEGALAGYTCCGSCALNIDRVRVLYFPGANDQCSAVGNGTALPRATQLPSAIGSTAVVSGYTFTSPSIYLQVLGAATVSDICGQVGPIRTNIIIPLPSGGLSTVSYPVAVGSEYTDPNYRGGGGLGSSFGVTQAIDTANFACPTWGLGIPYPQTTTFAGGITQTNYHTLVTTPFNPILIPPPQLQYLDPAWAVQCTAFYSYGEHIFSYGLYDPPYALTPDGGELDPSPAPAPTPAPIASTTAVDPIMTTPATPVPSSPSVFAPKTVTPSSNMLQLSLSSVPQSPSADPPAIPAPSVTAVGLSQDPGSPPKLTAQQSASAPQDPGLPQTASSPQDPNLPQNPSSLQNPGSPQKPSPIQDPSPTMNPGSSQDPTSNRSPSFPQNPSASQNPVSPQNPDSPQTPNTVIGGNNPPAPSNLGGIIYSAFGGPNSGVASTIAIPNSSPGTVAIGGQPVTIINPSAIAVNGETYTAGGAAATVSGEVISLASAGDAPIFPANTPGPSVLTIAGQTLSVNPGALTIAGTTLTPGGSGVTVSGTPISLGPSGIVVVGSSTLIIATPVPSIAAPSPSVIVAGGQTITAAGTSALVLDHTTLVAGGPGVTISGTPFSLAPSGTLVVGTSNVALPSGLGTSTINPFTGVAGRVDVERWWKVGGTAAGATLLVWGVHW